MDFVTASNFKGTPQLDIFQTIGNRDDQQDRFVVARLDTGLLVAVADGHGGHKTSSFVADHLTHIFAEEMDHSLQNDKRAKMVGLPSAKLRRVIRKTIQRLSQMTADFSSGSTITLAFIEKGSFRPNFSPAMRVTVGQLGDSIFALSTKAKKLNVSPFHSVATNKRDVQLIKDKFTEKYGYSCTTSYNYINSSSDKYNSLALTRALGDCLFTLIREPEVKTYKADPKETLILLATDGIIEGNSSKPRQAINNILQKIRQGSCCSDIARAIHPMNDNTTLIAIDFRE